MRIRIEKFCSLATARDWQTWLYKYDELLYRQFIAKLRQAHGCSENRELMLEMLDIIDKRGDGPRLSTFIQLYYPSLVVSNKPSVNQSEWDRLFNHRLLTYPHRKMLAGNAANLAKAVEQFLSDKINYEFLIVDDKAYIEYLNKGEEGLIDAISPQNWLIRAKKNA